MQLEYHTPEGPLGEVVDAIIHMDGNGTGVAFQRPYQTIIINLDDGFGVSDLYMRAAQRKDLGASVWINGKQEVPFMLENIGHMRMYVIILQPGMLPFLAGLPAIETNEQAVCAQNWATDAIFFLREQLLGCSSVRFGFALIETYLIEVLGRRKGLDQLSKVRWMGEAMPGHSVEEMCRMLGVTRKKLRSEAQYYFGGSVKNIQGILRFNKTLSEIAHHSDKTLTSLHDYYDQSHFINDFKARCGISPLQYKRLCQQYPEIRYTPNFLSMGKETFLQFLSARQV